MITYPMIARCFELTPVEAGVTGATIHDAGPRWWGLQHVHRDRGRGHRGQADAGRHAAAG